VTAPFAAALAALLFSAATLAQPVDPASQKARAVVLGSIDKLAGSTTVRAERSTNDLGWDCLAMVKLADSGDERALRRVRAIADELVRDVQRGGPGGVSGWTTEIADKRCTGGGYDAFGDKTCNPPGTPYALQTGLANACLALASKRLSDPALLKVARESFWSWKGVMLQDAPCRPDCAYFPTSSHPNDRDRYVRNMNVFMALAGLALGKAGDAEAERLGRAAMKSELAEQAQGNRGYLGVLDRQYKAKPQEVDRIENHAAAVSITVAYMAELTGEPAYAKHAMELWRVWAECDNDRCRKATCSYWSADPARCQNTHTSASCAFRAQSPQAAKWCEDLLSKVPAVGSYGVLAWQLGSAGPDQQRSGKGAKK
jgi:hypothetical protein